MTKTLLMLGAGLEQCIALAEAQRLGYKVVACDGSASAPGLQLADIGIHIDINNSNELSNIGKQYGVSGVFCHAVELPEVVAQVAENLNLPGIPFKTALQCKDKASRISILNKFGVPTPDFMVITCKNQLLAKIDDIIFPCVIKPTCNAGSRGVSLVKDAHELIPAYQNALLHANKGAVLIESYIHGPQVSTESLIYGGKITTYAFADRNYNNESFFYPFFIEDGINFPTQLPPRMIRKVLKTVEEAIRALNIEFGAAKGDILIHNGVPHVLEMAARTSGGWFSAGSIPIATGINALRPLLQMSMGDTPNLESLVPTKLLCCAQRYWIPKRNSILKHVSNLNTIKELTGVQMFNAFFPPEGTRLHKCENHSQRCAQVICTAQTLQEAISSANYAIQSIKVDEEYL